MATLPDVPQRTEGPVYDEAIAATPADGDPAKPVGLGAFVFEWYTPGNGNAFSAVRNEDYWRGPNGITGEDLPYLDAIEIVVAVDIDSRSNALRSGQFDIMHTANADKIASSSTTTASRSRATAFGETVVLPMLNVAAGAGARPGGQERRQPAAERPVPPGAGPRHRPRAINEERDAGLARPANGPFPPGSIGYLEDTGYPEYDVDAAHGRRWTVPRGAGTDNIEFRFNTTNDPFNVETNTLVQSMWHDAFGDQVEATITPIEQGQYIGLALTGTFSVLQWRSHSGSTRISSGRGGRGRRRPRSARAGAELRPRLRTTVIDEELRHQVEPRPGRPPGGSRDDQQALRRAGRTTCG